ncbi:hypothetical protein EUGRSUZ_J02731 [Eucalyptus grandis]|uniref:Uncharacterized protein n=2 Tax=Eucalyptus grandis TaxID=71139 RepID=A0ACC3J9M4_EUCGR|nr:hypothetical protein EUGRSUZ_J02731 [Eucalyptus grandis]
MTLNLCVLTPNRIVWDSEVKEIILSTNTGQIGFRKIMIGIADPRLWNLGVGLLSKLNGQLGSFHRLSRVEPWDLTADLKANPREQ